MTYTEHDILQAVIVALEWGECGVGIAAERAQAGGEVYPGGGAALRMSGAAVELLARAQAAIDRESERTGGGEPYLARESRGVAHYDYTGV